MGQVETEETETGKLKISGAYLAIGGAQGARAPPSFARKFIHVYVRGGCP